MSEDRGETKETAIGPVVSDVGSVVPDNGSTRSGHCGESTSTESLVDSVKVKVKPENVSNEVAVKKEPTPADGTSNGGEFSLSTTNLTLIRNQQQQQEVESARAGSGVKVEVEEAKKPKLTNGHHERRDH